MRKAAIIAISVLLVYYEVYRWLPLGRWNWQFAFPVQNDQFYPDLVIGVLLIGFVWSFATARKAGMWTAALLLSLWMAVHLADWWIPYACDLPANAGRYSFYQPHTQILPAFRHHYPPDGGHAVLDFLLFPACVLAIAASFGQTLKKRPPTA